MKNYYDFDTVFLIRGGLSHRVTKHIQSSRMSTENAEYV